MFTGLIETVGHVSRRSFRGSGAHIVIASPVLARRPWVVGESIAVNGVCLTVVEGREEEFSADLSSETLARTVLGALRSGSPVNLERALKVGDALGGHMVSGHVDGVARVRQWDRNGEGHTLAVEIPRDLARYVARKGSLCIDGVSLTVNAVEGSVATFAIIPHTLSVTTLGRLEVGALVNIEVDLVARYLERLLGTDHD